MFSGPVQYLLNDSENRVWYSCGKSLIRVSENSEDSLPVSIDLSLSLNSCIQGFSFFDNFVLVWASEQFLLINTRSLTILTSRKASQWILSGLYDLESSRIVLVTIWNRLEVFTVFPDYNASITASIPCPCPMALLYSADISIIRSFAGLSSSFLIVCGGVMSDMFCWVVSESLSNNIHCEVYSNHKGSIFKVKYFPDRKSVLSCSDDRNVILWDLVVADDETWNLQKTRVFGSHGARVWDAKFFTSGFVVTACEDKLIRVFSLSDESTLVTILRGHELDVWTLCVVQDKVLYSGGEDGSIKKWILSLEDFMNSSSFDGLNWNLPEGVGVEVGDKKINKSSDWIRALHWRRVKHTYELFCVTNCGSLWSISENRKLWEMEYKTVITTTSTSGNLLSLGTINGSVINIRFRDDSGEPHIVKEFHELFSYRVNFMSSTFSRNSFFGPNCFIASDFTGKFSIYDDSEILLTGKLNSLNSLKILSFSDLRKGEGSFLLFGDEHGFVIVHDVCSNTSTRLECRFGKEKILSISISNDNYNNTIFITTSAGQVFVCVFQVEDVKLSICRVVSIPSLRHVSGLLFGRYAYGFFGDMFSVFDILDSQEVFQDHCGGARRPFALCSDEADGRLSIAFLKDSVVKICKELKVNYLRKTLVRGIRAGNIHDVLPIVGNQDIITEEFLIATEESKLSLISTIRTLNSFRVEKEYSFHSNAVKCLSLVSNETLLVSAGASNEINIFHYDKDLGIQSHIRRVFLNREDLGDFRILCCVGLEASSIFFGDSTGAVSRYDMSSDSESIIISKRVSNGVILCMDLSLNHLFCGLSNGRVLKIPIAKEKQNIHVQAQQVHEAGVNTMHIVLDFNVIVTAGDDQRICLTSADTFILLYSLDNAHHSSIRSLCMIDKNVLGSVGWDRRLRLWKLCSIGKNIISIGAVHRLSVTEPNCIKLCSGGRRVVVGGRGFELIDLSILLSETQT